MTEKIKIIIKTVAEKIPKEKRSIVAIVCGMLLMLIILFSDLTPENKTVSEGDSETTDYVKVIEEKLSDIVASIDGAGKTKVMVTLDSSEENIYAADINDSKSEYVVIKTSSEEGGLLLKIIQPKIRGVAIVCDGGDSYRVKNDIINAVCSVLDISSYRVSISKMKN